MTFIERWIGFFAKRHLLANLMFFSVIFGGVFAWRHTNKEEMPAVTFENVRISVRYPGAPAEDVEYFISEPIEKKVRGLDGVRSVESTSSVGQASVSVALEPGNDDIDEVITEIRNAVLDIRYPDGVIDDPSVRVFKTTKKAIIDVALFHKNAELLDLNTRRELQRYGFALENRLLALREVHSINRRGYLGQEIQVRVKPDKLRQFNIPFNKILREIRTNHVRQPAGTLEAPGEPKVTLLSELKTKAALENLAVQGGFEGQVVRLGQVAEIVEGFQKTKQVMKVNGHEAIIFNVVKSPSYGILEALDATVAEVERFRKNNLRATPIEMVLLDDESIDVRNRLALIGYNGSLGFTFVLLMLFLFLNKRAGIWVALGIPFTLCFTMIVALALGFTVNGTTLGAVIIVMGIVVDDAIVVAENIAREIRKGLPRAQAVVKGAAFVTLPIIASVTTTMVAFIPLYFFEGHFGRFVSFIPPIIFLMLGASLFESLLILPGHLNLKFPWDRSSNGRIEAEAGRHWFDRWEDRYGKFLKALLPWKWGVVVFLLGGLLLAGWVWTNKMKFVMFPHEETRDIVLSGMTERGSTRYDTARKVREIERILDLYLGKESVGYRTWIARGRRGGASLENRFRILFEIVPKAKREKSADQIVKELEAAMAGLKGFKRLRFRKSRWGHQSGSPIEILVQQNDDGARQEITEALREKLEAHPALKGAEIAQGQFNEEYRITIKRERLKRLSISAADVATTFRAALEGIVLYEFSDGNEEVRVRLTTVDSAKDDINKVLSIPVENTRNYLVPLADVVKVEKVTAPSSISRHNMKRTTRLYADLKEGTDATPVEVAIDLEERVFPEFLAKYPTTTLVFDGEVKDTRDSENNFRNAAILAVILIYAILAILFDSALKPLPIMLAIPFGAVGVVLAFWAHGKILFGFYAAVGVLGLAGVVVNDSIIMLVRLDEMFDLKAAKEKSAGQIAAIAKTRLRAVVLTTLTTVAGVMPTAYGLLGYDAMLAEMMLALAWGMIFGTIVTLVLVPCLYAFGKDLHYAFNRGGSVIACLNFLNAGTNSISPRKNPLGF